MSGEALVVHGASPLIIWVVDKVAVRVAIAGTDRDVLARAIGAACRMRLLFLIGRLRKGWERCMDGIVTDGEVWRVRSAGTWWATACSGRSGVGNLKRSRDTV